MICHQSKAKVGKREPNWYAANRKRQLFDMSPDPPTHHPDRLTSSESPTTKHEKDRHSRTSHWTGVRQQRTHLSRPSKHLRWPYPEWFRSGPLGQRNTMPRIRNNQRRHRAKTKAYIAELERQLAAEQCTSKRYWRKMLR